MPVTPWNQVAKFPITDPMGHGLSESFSSLILPLEQPTNVGGERLSTAGDMPRQHHQTSTTRPITVSYAWTLCALKKTATSQHDQMIKERNSAVRVWISGYGMDDTMYGRDADVG